MSQILNFFEKAAQTPCRLPKTQVKTPLPIALVEFYMVYFMPHIASQKRKQATMGTVVTVVILVAVAALAVYGVRHMARVASGKDGCCGGGGTGRPSGTRVRRARRDAPDTDPAHYPYTTELTVRGMTCEKCVQRVEDSLNALPGTWAVVDLPSRIATVHTKESANAAVLEDAIEAAGYSVIHL